MFLKNTSKLEKKKEPFSAAFFLVWFWYDVVMFNEEEPNIELNIFPAPAEDGKDAGISESGAGLDAAEIRRRAKAGRRKVAQLRQALRMQIDPNAKGQKELFSLHQVLGEGPRKSKKKTK